MKAQNKTQQDRIPTKLTPRVALMAFASLSLTLGTLISISGCGKQAYLVTSSNEKIQAPGTYSIPPKVDVLLIEDDTGSIKESYSSISSSVNKVLSELQTRNWDYHFATIPLTKDRLLSQVQAAKFDINWGADWLPAYPGASPTEEGAVNATVFRRPESYTGFLAYDDSNNSLNGVEPGFKNIRQALYQHLSGTGFLRGDALFVMIMIGNGQDTSDVNFCKRDVDGLTVYCNDGSWESSLNFYKNEFLRVKPDPKQIKFYAAVANSRTDNCLGSVSYKGTRYQWMASELGGASFDVCTQTIPTVLDSVAQSLAVQKLSFRTRYVFMSQEPELSTIQVKKLLGGDPAQSVTIPQDPVNGWTYAGKVKDVYVIDAPVPMNQASGWAIELHGDAKLLGNDLANVTFKPVGAKDSPK